VRIYLNGEATELASGATVEEVVARLVPNLVGCAAARNGEIVSRREWSKVTLQSEDRVEVLGAVPGG
jgi:sulfur carrier protein